MNAARYIATFLILALNGSAVRPQAKPLVQADGLVQKAKSLSAPQVWPKKLATPLPPFFQRWFDRIGPDDGFEMRHFEGAYQPMQDTPYFRPIFTKEDIVNALLKVKGAHEGRAWLLLKEEGYQPEDSLQKSAALEYPKALMLLASRAITTTSSDPGPTDPGKERTYKIRATQRLLELARGGELHAMMLLRNHLSRLAVGMPSDVEALKLFLPEELVDGYWDMKAGEKALSETEINYEVLAAKFQYALILERSRNPEQKLKGLNLLQKLAGAGEYEAMQMFWIDAKAKGDAAGMETWAKRIRDETGSYRGLPQEPDDSGPDQ